MRFGPGLDRAFAERQTRIGNYQIEIETDGVAETLTRRTCTVGIVEAEQARLRHRVDSAVVFTFEAFRKTQASGLVGGSLNHRLPVSFAKTGFQRIYQTLANVFARRQAINQDIDVLKVLQTIVIRRSKIDLPSLVY